MKLHHKILKFSVIFFFLYGYSAVAQSAEHILISKLGVVDRNDNVDYTANADRFDFDDDLVASLGFTYLYMLDNGVAFGVETFTYKNDIVSTSINDGDATTTHLYGIVEKIFNTGGAFKPFIGLGLGVTSVSINGHLNGDVDDDYNDFAAGLSYQVFAGAEVKINERFGVTVEYKYFDFEIDDDIGNKNINIEGDGSALFVGLAIHL